MLNQMKTQFYFLLSLIMKVIRIPLLALFLMSFSCLGFSQTTYPIYYSTYSITVADANANNGQNPFGEGLNSVTYSMPSEYIYRIENIMVNNGSLALTTPVVLFEPMSQSIATYYESDPMNFDVYFFIKTFPVVVNESAIITCDVYYSPYPSDGGGI